MKSTTVSQEQGLHEGPEDSSCSSVGFVGDATEAHGSLRHHSRKRARVSRQEGVTTAGGSKEFLFPECPSTQPGHDGRCREGLCPYELCLYVRSKSPEGRSRVTRLALDPIASVDDLRGLFRRLISGAFSGSDLPDYLTSPDFYKFTPAEDFVTLPGDIATTHFRLVLALGGGWEYGVVDRQLGVDCDPDRSLLVTVAEFESDVFEAGGQECVLSLLSYPTISVKKDLLDRAMRNLQQPLLLGQLPGGAGELVTAEG